MAKIYWRTIKRGTRTFDAIPENLKEAVIAIAKAEVADGTITADDYKRFIGEDYTA